MISNFFSKKYLQLLLPIIYLLFATIAAYQTNIHLWVIAPPVVFSTVALTLVSPPLAAALVFMSHNLLGLVTINHPGFLFQLVPTLTLLITLVWVRRKEFFFIQKTKMRPQTWAMLAIILIFLMGFFHSIFNQINMFSLSTFTELFKASHGGLINYYPYVFLSRWTLFVSIGALCCRGRDELKLFLFGISFFVISQMLAVPLESYRIVIGDMLFSRINIYGLQTININRAYLGYLFAVASFIMLTFGVYQKQSKEILVYLFGAFFFLLFCFLAGSNGPLIAFIVAGIFLMTQIDWIKNRRVVFFVLIFLAFIKMTPIFFQLSKVTSSPQVDTKAPSLAQVQVNTLIKSTSIRVDLAKAIIKKASSSGLFGGGLGNSIGTVESFYVDPVSQKKVSVVTGAGSHNMLLDFWADLGIVGVLVFIICIYVLVSSFNKENKYDVEGRFLVTLMSGVLIILLIFSLLATAPALATIQALFLGVLFGVGIKGIRRT